MTEAWRILDSQTVVKDRWIELRADRCLTPAGIEVAPYYVLGYPDWVHVVALTDEKQMVLVRQYRHAIGKFVLEIPGGVIEAADGDPRLAAQRELVEETGYTARDWKMIGSFYPNPATHTNQVHVVLALHARQTGDPSLDAGEEGLETVIMPIEEVLDGLASGLLGQSMHVAAVYLALTTAGLLRPVEDPSAAQ